MTRDHRDPSLLVAPVSGVAALVLASLLREHGDAARANVAALVSAGQLPPSAPMEVEQAHAAITAAAAEWRDWWGSARGRAVAEVLPRSEWITTKEASQVLQISEGRVRQLLRAGSLAGSFDGRAWRVSRASVDARRGGEGEAA